MPLICKDCNNKEEFEKDGWEEVRCYKTYDIKSYFDQNGEVYDTDMGDVRDESDDETVDSDYDTDFVCSQCGGDDVEDVSDEEWEAWNGPQPEEKQANESWKDYLKRK